MRKSYYLFLGLLFCMSAHAYDFENGGIYYDITSPTTVSVTNNEDMEQTYSGEVVIPETVNHENNSYAVTAVGKAFIGCSALTSVTLPNSITSIGDFAFAGSGLSSISIPANVTSIGFSAFENSSIRSIVIPDNVKSIGDNAFRSCSWLTSVTLPNGITSIGYGVFSGCHLLASITIPYSVTSIGECAFYECNSLADIHVLNTVPVSISDGTFTADVYSNARLHVPQGKATDYRNAEGWKNFINIVDDVVSGINSSYHVTDAKIFVSGNNVIIENARVGEPVFVYDISGKLLKTIRITDERSEMQLPMNRIYIIKCANKEEKIKL